jgi:hypothetical protein
MNLILKSFIIAMAVLFSPYSAAIAQPAEPEQLISVQPEEIATLSTQCGMFFYWSGDSSHFMVLALSKTGKYGFIPPGTQEALLVDNALLVVPSILPRKRFDSSNSHRTPSEILLMLHGRSTGLHRSEAGKRSLPTHWL